MVLGALAFFILRAVREEQVWRQALIERETRLVERTHELAAARDRAQEAGRVKGEFLAMMSHEIRTPLNAVIGFSEMIASEQFGPLGNPNYVEYAGDVVGSARHLLTIVNDILDTSKLEAGKVELEAIDFDLVETVEGAVTLMMPKAREKKVDLVVNIAPAARKGFQGDPTRIGQVLLNLLGNGLKFTEMGAVSVDVSAVSGLRGEPQPNTERIRFAIRDTGIGMPEQVCAGLFQKFNQADNSFTRRYGGTGLGLAISKQLVELMGGRIGVESNPGHGSNFWFELPLRPKDFARTLAAAPGNPPRRVGGHVELQETGAGAVGRRTRG
jgi:signal transduction histidine kinase